ncbi:unnamed protein product [Arctia plantaginis]|uniref:Uncharacterized protein n=1 Tax=Arctia plantaginis TaxID=874455 RepID=A0A8S1AML3_ARCPL|nr:unnamed protein product [Arctia plantaginis]
MVFLVQVSVRLNNDTVTKSVQAYTVLALLSTVWTIVTLIWIYQSNRHYASLRRIDLIRQQELQNENWP